MTIRKVNTDVITMTGATDTVSIGNVYGKILSVKIATSASNTFNVYTQNTASGVTEYILGANGAPITIATGTVFYPRVVGNLAATGAGLGAANNTNTYVPICIWGDVKIDVASGTAGDTYSVEIIYE